MLKSHAYTYSDLDTDWYKRWSKALKQTERGKKKYALKANKFWQNAVMAQALYERGALQKGNSGVGFGVGKERLPALFANLDVHIMATDQDFSKNKAKEWDNDQLAHGRFSLNEDKICEPSRFRNNVDFAPVDMAKIPKKYSGKYDFLWSNCALGHLGTIDKGLEFIEKSLECLKPGGWAVHTTEVNILSNKDTVDNRSTVIFRVKDIYRLSKRLTNKGYVCEPMILTLGKTKQDARIAIRPAWGNDYSKILVGSHIATQVVLIIHRPKSSKASRRLDLFTHRIAYQKNKKTIRNYGKLNPTLKLLLKSVKAKPQDFDIKPAKPYIKLSKSKQKKPVFIEYINRSSFALAGVFEYVYSTKPIILATDKPTNHASKFTNTEWFNPTRPAIKLLHKKGSEWIPADFIHPGEKFGFEVYLDPKTFKDSSQEYFSIVLEGAGVIPGTQVKVTAGA